MYLCINVSRYLYSTHHTRYNWTGSRRCFRTIHGAPENDDRVNSEIQPEAVIELVWRCTWSDDRAYVEIHLDALIE